MNTKITYATMSAERMEDLHRELDHAIEEVRTSFGKSYPMMIGGQAVKAAGEFDDRSPIDTRILLGKFQQGSREDVQRAITAARSAFPSWSGRPWRERVMLLKNTGSSLGVIRPHGLRGRQEQTGMRGRRRRVGGSH
jgi:1-pyrroline-5-carboxylate dehydrogenase